MLCGIKVSQRRGVAHGEQLSRSSALGLIFLERLPEQITQQFRLRLRRRAGYCQQKSVAQTFPEGLGQTS